MPSSIVTSKGQITIPIEVRQRLGLETGNRVDFIEMDDGRYALMAATVDIRSLRGSVSKPPKPVSVEDMNRTVRERAAGRRPAGR
ncbi:MAG: AbrB/MazE/SpoVT family DNA-binding domain-containing protein [Gammaproteobacteria bacterium]|nr:AbrB/MazE/SpoVT family DNA-binding domain-containing protein [Gammaproteobacteria bacterium]